MSERVATPILTLAKKGVAADRLRQLADDCEERARRSDSEEARGQYHSIADSARRTAIMRGLDELDRLQRLRLLRIRLAVARSYDGEPLELPDPVDVELDSEGSRRIEQRNSAVSQPSPADQSSAVPAEARNARQLAAAFGVPERTARYRIMSGATQGRAGFYRQGSHWYALPEAFAVTCRISADRSRSVTQRP